MCNSVISNLLKMCAYDLPIKTYKVFKYVGSKNRRDISHNIGLIQMFCDLWLDFPPAPITFLMINN